LKDPEADILSSAMPISWAMELFSNDSGFWFQTMNPISILISCSAHFVKFPHGSRNERESNSHLTSFGQREIEILGESIGFEVALFEAGPALEHPDVEGRRRNMIDRPELLAAAGNLGLLPSVVEKDYVLGWVLAGIFKHPVLAKH